jgi:hypothetical protein
MSNIGDLGRRAIMASTYGATIKPAIDRQTRRKRLTEVASAARARETLCSFLLCRREEPGTACRSVELLRAQANDEARNRLIGGMSAEMKRAA